jgi:hypothetical protein
MEAVMDFIGAFVLIICGILLIPPVLKSVNERIRSIRGIIGIVAGLAGVFGLVYWIFNTEIFYAFGPRGFTLWLTGLSADTLAVAIGFLLSFDMFAPKIIDTADDETKRSVETIAAKLEALGTPLGIAAIGIGAWAFLFTIVFRFVWRLG